MRTYGAGLVCALSLVWGCSAADEREETGSGPEAPRIESFMMKGAVVDVLSSGELVREALMVKGRELRWRGKVQARAVAAGKEPLPKNDGMTIDSLSEQELAEGMRTILYYQGHEYMEVQPAWEAARRAKAQARSLRDAQSLATFMDAMRGSPPFNGTGEPADESDVFTPKSVLGTDTRTVANNTAYPHRTHVIWDNTQTQNGITNSDGTASIIGRSTALSMAHVFWDESNNTWSPGPFLWAPGFDNQDANPMPFGGWIGCYWVAVTGGYATHENVFWDFSVIDFNVPCGAGNDFIGDTTSWLGTWIPSSGQISGNAINVRGYPRPGTCGNPGTACNARVWGSSNTGAVLSGVEIRHQTDTSDGQSGSAAYINFDPPGAFPHGPYLVGIHGYGNGGGGYNIARMFDSTVHSWLVSNSDDF